MSSPCRESQRRVLRHPDAMRWRLRRTRQPSTMASDDERPRFLDTGPTPAVLYHYTSMQTLLDIVHSGRMRASHVRYLNDTTETTHNHLLTTRRTRPEAP